MRPVNENEGERRLSDDDVTLDLTQEADAVRASLLHTVEELDHRRHQALDVKYQVRQHLTGVIAAGAIGVVAALGGLVMLIRRAATAGERRRIERMHMLERLWMHPEQVAQAHEKRPSFVWSLGRTVLMGLASRAVRRATA
jgi:hypothetical protein